MRRRVPSLVLLSSLFALSALGAAPPPAAQAGKTEAQPTDAKPADAEVREVPKGDDGLVKGEARPVLEVAFVLDTTGSMGGLLEGAKQKIWSIASRMASGKPTPRIRVGLVAYRDRTDAYVTQTFDLSEDLDAVYKNLRSFTAGGGGDTPEHVGKGLADAVEKLSWTTQGRVARMIFLVGDAPASTTATATTRPPGRRRPSRRASSSTPFAAARTRRPSGSFWRCRGWPTAATPASGRTGAWWPPARPSTTRWRRST